MARQRTGTLIYRPTQGYCGLVTREVNGETVREWVVLGTHNKQAAKRKLAREVAKAATGAPSGTGDAANEETFQEYATGWLETRDPAMAKDERMNLRLHVFPEIGHLALSRIKAPDVRGVLDACIGKGLRKGTIVHVRGVTYRVLKSAWRDDLVPANVVEKVEIPKLREPKKERAILSDDEIARYLACPTVDLELRMMSLASRVEGGMRLGDVNRWDWAMIDRVRFAECIVPRAKTNKPQHLELPEVLGAVLRQRWEGAGQPESGPIFPVRVGARAGQFRSPRGTSCARRLRRDLLRAGVIRHVCTRKPTIEKAGRQVRNPPVQVAEACCPNMAYDPLFTETAVTRPVDFHSFRRAFSTALANAGVNSQQAMRLASHSDEKTHMRYVMTTAAMKQIPEAAVPKLPLGLLHQKQQTATIELAKPLAENQNAERFFVPAPVAQLDRASDFEGEANPVQPSLAGSTPSGATADDKEIAEASGPLLFAATNERARARSWLAVLADLGPGFVRASLELPAGAVDKLVAIGGAR